MPYQDAQDRVYFFTYISARRLRRMMLPGLSSATVVALFALMRFIHPATRGLSRPMF